MGIHLVVPFLVVGLMASLASVSSTEDCIRAITSGTRIQARAKAEAYVQSQIGKVQSYLNAKYEPLYLRNLDDLHSLKVEGISSIKLIGKPRVILSGNKLKGNVRMVFDQLKSEADLNKKIRRNYIVTGRLYSTIKGMELFAQLSFDLQHSARPTLVRATVTKWGTITANIVRSNVPNLRENQLRPHVKKATPKIIDTVFKKVLREYKVECPP